MSLRFLDNWARRRVRKSYAKTLAVRDDAYGVASFLAESFTRGEPYTPAWVTSVFWIGGDAVWKEPQDVSSLTPRELMRAAAFMSNAVTFYVRNPVTHSVHAVYVTDDETERPMELYPSTFAAEYRVEPHCQPSDGDG